MKLALIPPVSLLHTTYQTNYQLMLPQLARNKQYSTVYREHCRDTNTYVILDNGAAEGYTPGDNEVLHLAIDFKVDEIVLPDVLGNAEETLKRSRAYLDMLHKKGMGNKFNFMFVCQGQDMFEFVDSADTAVRWPEITAIGIPRHAIATCADELVRSSIANILQSGTRFNKQIHFLGASPAFPREATILSSTVNTKQNFVRGMDTSMPFNYAFKGLDLSDSASIQRTTDYFSLPAKAFSAEFLQKQIDTFKVWSRVAETMAR